MKKYLVLIAAAITLGFTSCSEEDCNHFGEGKSTVSYEDIAGSWYDPVYNEEVKYTENGTFHDKYSNKYQATVTEGRYELRANKLTYTYSFMGQTQFTDFTISNFITDLTFSLNSKKTAKTILYKITEVINLDLGGTATLPSYGLESPDDRIVSVDGLEVKSMGMKGTVYLKNSNDTYVKVIVGDDANDLWMDYSQLIGKKVSDMKELLGEPTNLSENHAFYNEVGKTHDLICYVGFFIENGVITSVGLYFNDGVDKNEILRYVASKYFYNTSIEMYTSHEPLNSSLFVVKYLDDANCLLFQKKPAIIKDYTGLFGKDKNGVKSFMETNGSSYLMSSDSYSENGSDYYSISDNNYTEMVGFVFNPDNQMSEYWVYLKSTSALRTVYDELCSNYIEEKTEETDYSYVFYNKDKTIKVTLDLKSSAVVYNNQNMKQHVAKKNDFGTYYEALGLTQEQIIKKYGNPYSSDATNMTYVIGSGYINFVFLSLDSETKKCKTATITINDNASESTVLDYFNSKYTVFAKGTAEDGSQYAWLNGASLAESTLGIIYFPQDKMIIYQPLGSAANNAKVHIMANVRKTRK